MNRRRAIARVLLALYLYFLALPVLAQPAQPSGVVPPEPAAVGQPAGAESADPDGGDPAAAPPEVAPSVESAPSESPTVEGEQPSGPAGEETPAAQPGTEPSAPPAAEPGTEPSAQPGSEPGPEAAPPELQPGANPSTLEDRNPVSPPIVNIEIEGNQTVPAQAILEVVSTRIGDPLLEPRLRRDLQAIFDLGYFTDVRFATPSAPGGIRLVFRVLENPVVNGIEFRGNQVVDSQTLLQQMDTKVGEVLAAMKSDGTLASLTTKWYGKDYSAD